MEEQYQSNVHPASVQSGGGKKTWLIMLLVIVCVIGAAGGVYYWQQQKITQQKAELQSQIDALNSKIAELNKKVEDAEKINTKKKDASSQGYSVTKDTYTLNLPSTTWKETPAKYTFPSLVNQAYQNESTGEYFQVIVDPGGSDPSNDMSWTYKVASNGVSLEFVSSEQMCKSGVFCSVGDNKLNIVVFTGDESLKGHRYFFYLENTKSERADTAVFKDIIGSFRAK